MVNLRYANRDVWAATDVVKEIELCSSFAYGYSSSIFDEEFLGGLYVRRFSKALIIAA